MADMTLRLRQRLGPCLAGIVAACSSPATTDPIEASLQQSQAGSSATADGLNYEVATRLADAPAITDPLLRPTITTTANIRNDRSEPVTLTYGACNVSLVAHTNADRRGPPVWQSYRSEPWEGTYGRGCTAILLGKTLAPGAELALGSYSSRVIEVLGDSLPNGHYWFTATLGVSSAPNGVVLPAGDFELALTRPALRDSVIHDLLTYKATSNVSGGVVQGRVTATLTHAGGSLVEFPRECAMEIVAYRTQERRDAAPLSGAPDWRATRTCGTGWRQVGLNRGESTSFEATATAREILGSSLPAGTYHFAAIIHARTRNIWLSAGSGELRR